MKWARKRKWWTQELKVGDGEEIGSSTCGNRTEVPLNKKENSD